MYAGYSRHKESRKYSIAEQQKRNNTKLASRGEVSMATEKPVKVGLFGGKGQHDEDINQNQLPKALEMIEIWYNGPKAGSVINGIRFVYIDSNNTPITVPDPDTCWGTKTGDYKKIDIAILGKEYVSQIDGTIGKDPNGEYAITSLTFTTNKGTPYGPFGDTANGTLFTVPLNNAGVYGFFASFGKYLNALGFYTHQPDNTNTIKA